MNSSTFGGDLWECAYVRQQNLFLTSILFETHKCSHYNAQYWKVLCDYLDKEVNRACLYYAFSKLNSIDLLQIQHILCTNNTEVRHALYFSLLLTCSPN